MLRQRRPPSADVFPVDPWKLSAIKFDAETSSEFIGQTETMFALSNGYLGMRGTLDEGEPIEEPGTYLNGFYEYRPIVYGETAYGFPKRGQSMLNCPDGIPIRLLVDDEPFDAASADVTSFCRQLHLREGLLERDVEWRTQSAKRVGLHTLRLVSLADRHLAAIQWELRLPEAGAEIVIVSDLVRRQPLPLPADDPRLAYEPEKVLRSLGTHGSGARAVLVYGTRHSGLVLGCGVDHAIESDSHVDVDAKFGETGASIVFRLRAARGAVIRLSKYLTYHYDKAAAPFDMIGRVGSTLDGAVAAGFPAIRARQKAHVAAFWKRADVEIDTPDPRMQQVVRWNLFQLLQASECVQGQSIGVRGLTGRTYEGHYFWDTEIYLLPFLIYTAPAVARHVLKFRYDTLDKARARAAELDQRGAAFPWRTINGEEASAYYAAGTAQYHINADIAYAVRKYVEVTGDEDFLYRHGAEILVETARLWRDLGFFSKRRDGRFCINGVTGPDEYNAVVDNNYFTNLMASANMAYAAEVVERMRALAPMAHDRLVARTGLREEEPHEWREAAELMYLPYDERLKVHPQDDSFLDKEVWDFENTPEGNYPLLLHYHPLNLYRRQVIKQADTLLAMFLLGDQFSEEEKKRNFDYYDPITTHDSSLSVCIQSIVANEIGYRRKAADYFSFAATMDLADVGGNMKHGAHIASIGGTWMALVYGFAGLRDYGGQISFRPSLPAEWRSLGFRLRLQGRLLEVHVEHGMTHYRLMEGEGLTIRHSGEELHLTDAEPQAHRPTPPSPAVEPGAGPGSSDPKVPGT